MYALTLQNTCANFDDVDLNICARTPARFALLHRTTWDMYKKWHFILVCQVLFDKQCVVRCRMQMQRGLTYCRISNPASQRFHVADSYLSPFQTASHHKYTYVVFFRCFVFCVRVKEEGTSSQNVCVSMWQVSNSNI